MDSLLPDTSLEIFGSPLDMSTPQGVSTSPSLFDTINSYVDRAFTLYEKGVDTKIGAANTVLDYPKLIINAALAITGGVLIYKLLINKRKARA